MVLIYFLRAGRHRCECATRNWIRPILEACDRVPQYVQQISQRPHILCPICGALFYERSQLRPSSLTSIDGCPAVLVFPQHVDNVTYARDGRVYVCGPCSGLLARSAARYRLADLRMFLDFGPTPDVIAILNGRERAMLSLVQLCASTFRPSLPTQFTYSWFKGTCKALVKDVAGTVGVLVDDDWAGQARPLDKDSRARVMRAMRWLIGHNPFFAQYLCLAERRSRFRATAGSAVCHCPFYCFESSAHPSNGQQFRVFSARSRR